MCTILTLPLIPSHPKIGLWVGNPRGLTRHRGWGGVGP